MNRPVAEATTQPAKPDAGSAPPAPTTVPTVESESSQSKLKWYKTVNKNMSRTGHPYELQLMRLQDPKEKRKRYEDVKFWPFVGALRPRLSPLGHKDWSWQKYENTVALCTEGTLVVARCTEDNPWNVLWELTLDDHPYCLAWSYHPITLHPIIALAGHGALIHIIDALTKERLMILRGHGDDILSLTFHHLHPHILASTSSDKTTRIWNILGTRAPPPPSGSKLNENFPMGDADEGNVIIAILAGEGSGGHRAYVACSAFHPTQRVIATGGLDRMVKIWQLPPFPKITARPIPTPNGYRPEIVSFPMFSTNRLHADFVDGIDWLSEDVLLSRSSGEIVTWQWLSYQRYFPPPHIEGQLVPVQIQSSDYTNSSSFMVISRFPNGLELWGHNIAYHRAFKPDPLSGEESRLIKNPNLVSDPLIALSSPSSTKKHRGVPEISLWNPLLAEDDPAPEPLIEERYVPEDTDDLFGSAGDSREEEEAVNNQAENEDEEDDLESLTAANMEVDSETNTALGGVGVSAGVGMEDIYTPPTPASMRTPPASAHVPGPTVNMNGGPSKLTSPNGNGSSLPKNDQEQEQLKDDMTKKKKKKNISIEPWRLCADKSPWYRFSQSKSGDLGLDRQISVIVNCDISPRGAEYIVGVGVGLSVFVWKLKNSS